MMEFIKGSHYLNSKGLYGLPNITSTFFVDTLYVSAFSSLVNIVSARGAAIVQVDFYEIRNLFHY